MRRIEPTVIAVTGASRGIGAAIAVELARRGFRVACLTRRARRLRQGAAELAADSSVACDVTDESQPARPHSRRVVEQAAPCDGLVNNAGIHLDGASHELPHRDVRESHATNATAVYIACREAYPHLVKQAAAAIVNIGSFFDKIGVKRNVAYCASKAAVGAITRCLAVEWASRRHSRARRRARAIS